MALNFFPVTVDDYRRRAQKRLPRFLFDYIDGGSNDEATLAANIADFGKFCLKQQVMCDVSGVDTSTLLCGQPSSMPLALAPVGMAGMMAKRGEVQGAQAAYQAGIPFTSSTVGICSLEEIQAATQHPFWFQLYMLRDRDAVLALLERASAVGCETLVFTVDLAVAGMRHRDRRNGMITKGLKAKLATVSQVMARPRWMIDVGLGGKPHCFGNLSGIVGAEADLSSYKAFIDSQFDPSVTWQDIAWLRSMWKGQILIKGILEASDAQRAVDVGADAVVVSNHGGRQLDAVASSIAKLPEVVAAVADQVDVYMDGGVRSGIDVVKAVALGAKAVLVGRPWVWALAADQQAGLSRLLDLFQQEIAVAMALMGVNRIEDIHCDLLEK